MMARLPVITSTRAQAMNAHQSEIIEGLQRLHKTLLEQEQTERVNFWERCSLMHGIFRLFSELRSGEAIYVRVYGKDIKIDMVDSNKFRDSDVAQQGKLCFTAKGYLEYLAQRGIFWRQYNTAEENAKLWELHEYIKEKQPEYLARLREASWGDIRLVRTRMMERPEEIPFWLEKAGVLTDKKGKARDESLPITKREYLRVLRKAADSEGKPVDLELHEAATMRDELAEEAGRQANPELPSLAKALERPDAPAAKASCEYRTLTIPKDNAQLYQIYDSTYTLLENLAKAHLRQDRDEVFEVLPSAQKLEQYLRVMRKFWRVLSDLYAEKTTKRTTVAQR